MAVHHTQPLLITSGLIYHMDVANPKSYPGSGTLVSDLSGNKYNTTLVNAPVYNTANAGYFGFASNTLNQYMGGAYSVNTGNNFTVGAWVYVVTGGSRYTIVGNSYNYSGWNGWDFSLGGSSSTNSFFVSVGSDSAYAVAANNSLTLNKWYYLSAVVQNGGGALTLYVNGQAVSSYYIISQVAGTMTYSYQQFNVGARDTGGSPDYFQGNLASVHIYNRVLSAAEILQNFNAGRGRFGI